LAFNPLIYINFSYLWNPEVKFRVPVFSVKIGTGGQVLTYTL